MNKYHDFKVKDRNYRCTRMVAKTQFHVLRRILPLFAGMVNEGESISTSTEDMALSDMFLKVIDNLNKINTEDYDYILSQALHTVAREDAPGDYQNILAPNGVPMYEDINYDLSVMMEILMEVLKFNFKDFFKDLPSSIPERS